MVKRLIELGKEISYHQKIRIISSFVSNYFEEENDGYISKLFYIRDKDVARDNSYFLAFEFNKKVINNLTEESALTTGYIQINSYILNNYFLEESEKSYTFSNEPIPLMKYHLLMNYDNFIFINSKKPNKYFKINAEQDNLNRITFINELCLFGTNSSEHLTGKNYALPISIEFFHEKDSHSKKGFKNLRIESPLICYCNKKIIKRDEPEDGKFIESLIGDITFIKTLKESENRLGELMKIEYFIEKDFIKLHEKYNDIIKDSKIISKTKKKNESDLINLNNNEKISIKNHLENKPKETLSERKLETLQDYESAFLSNGIFVYPDSLPIHEYEIGEKPKPLSKGEQEYMNKYRPYFEEAKRTHLHIKNNLYNK